MVHLVLQLAQATPILILPLINVQIVTAIVPLAVVPALVPVHLAVALDI